MLQAQLPRVVRQELQSIGTQPLLGMCRQTGREWIKEDSCSFLSLNLVRCHQGKERLQEADCGGLLLHILQQRRWNGPGEPHQNCLPFSSRDTAFHQYCHRVGVGALHSATCTTLSLTEPVLWLLSPALPYLGFNPLRFSKPSARSCFPVNYKAPILFSPLVKPMAINGQMGLYTHSF